VARGKILSPAFKDHFSGHAAGYAQARPTYPSALFDWLGMQCARRELAWDAGCGNGQASVALAAQFGRVVATDPSATQVAAATLHPRVEYRVEAAEACSLPDRSVDLVTVAQALHWIDPEPFHAQVARVLRPDGFIAAWTYERCLVSPGVDAVFERLYGPELGAWWPPERRHVEARYATLPFPYAEVVAPVFELRCDWTLAQYLAYLRTWSACQRRLKAEGVDAVAGLEDAFATVWGAPDTMRAVRWPLAVRAGRLLAGA
jgi:SAM-dependent methyltransferase